MKFLALNEGVGLPRSITVCLVGEPRKRLRSRWCLDEERGSGAALGGIFPLDAGWLRPSEFEGRRRSAPVSALPFLSVS
jgi:hypothetical protein